jgi:hypothetical protein
MTVFTSTAWPGRIDRGDEDAEGREDEIGASLVDQDAEAEKFAGSHSLYLSRHSCLPAVISDAASLVVSADPRLIVARKHSLRSTLSQLKTPLLA